MSADRTSTGTPCSAMIEHRVPLVSCNRVDHLGLGGEGLEPVGGALQSQPLPGLVHGDVPVRPHRTHRDLWLREFSSITGYNLWGNNLGPTYRADPPARRVVQ